jgi:hypothetical protein
MFNDLCVCTFCFIKAGLTQADKDSETNREASQQYVSFHFLTLVNKQTTGEKRV